MVFTILIVLIVNNVLTSQFGFNQATFVPITIFLLLLGAGIYFFVSKQILDPLFKSDQNIQELIRQTLHELNTPVATIQMNSKMLANKIDDEKARSRLKRIDQSCENLLELYNQMEYELKTQIDSVNIETFDINDIILHSWDKFKDIKKQKSIKINYDPKSFNIACDKKGFEKAIDNLLSNAIKYNKQNGFIDIKLKDDTLIIKDTGIGIETKHLFTIFDKYYQENSSASGVGLGLSIVKGYCDKYKIQIKLDSKVDKGTTFYLNLKEVKV